ncbi:MAG TPA: hypothetical protein VMU88_09600 [bacterium]|nr:hypothetical protein [bacterium]
MNEPFKALIVLALFAAPGWGQTPATGTPTPAPNDAVWTQHNDSQRTGAYLCEKELSPKTVHPGGPFHLKGTLRVSDAIYAQPLYVPRVDWTDGSGPAKPVNMVFVATVDDRVYAFNADPGVRGGNYLWRAEVFDPATEVPTNSKSFPCQAYSGAIQVPMNLGTFYKNIGKGGNIGIMGTPVIDRLNGLLYVLARATSTDGSRYIQRLWALDIHDGHVIDRLDIPATFTDDQGVFDPQWENPRAALTLSADADTVYAAWAGQCDTELYHGWVMAFRMNPATRKLSLAARFNDTRDNDKIKGEGAGIWQAGQGPALDGAGNLYVISGNGDFNQYERGGNDFGDSFIKLDGNLHPVDYFTPSNQRTLDNTDYDMGSAGPLVLLKSLNPGAPSDLIIGAGKECRYYVLRSDNLGKYDCRGNDAAYQSAFITIGALVSHYYTPGEIPQTPEDHCLTNHVHGGSVYWTSKEGNQADHHVYVMPENDYARAYVLGPDFRFPVKGDRVYYTKPVTAIVPRVLVSGSHQPVAVVPSFVGFTLGGEKTREVNRITGDKGVNEANPYAMSTRKSVGMPGGILSLSADGDDPNSGILWVSIPQRDAYLMNQPQPVYGTLVAYEANAKGTLKELWRSDANAKDAVGEYAKYVPPTVANGRVYLATFSNRVDVYGLK